MSSRRSQIVLLVLVVVSTVLLTGLWKTYTDRPPGSRAAGVSQPVEATSRAHALTLLRSWDARRAAAYAAGDADALAELYLPGSVSGANDRRVLRQYLARGLRVQEMRTQILDLTIRDEGESSLSLLVTDRLSGGVAVGAAGRARLPRDQATTRQLDLQRVGLRWLMVEAEQIDPSSSGTPTGQADTDRSSAEESTSTTPVSRKP